MDRLAPETLRPVWMGSDQTAYPEAPPPCRLWLAVFCALWLSGCAKTGEPRPPVVLIPKPAMDLTVRQVSDQVLLTVALPATNTDGSPVTTLGSVQIYRRGDGDRENAAPLAEAEFLHGAEQIASIPADQIARDTGAATLSFRDELLLPDRSVIYQRAFRYALRFSNRRGRSAGISNQAFIAPVPVPPAPGGLDARVTRDAIVLQWLPPSHNLDGSVPPRIAGHNIYRSEDPGRMPGVPLNSEPIRESSFEDRSFEFDRTYGYVVAVVASRENPSAESLASPMLAVTPRDTFAPGAPQNFNVVVASGSVVLLWAAPSDSDVAGYRVYRRESGIADWKPLTPALLEGLSHRDSTAQAGRKYEYRVSAVDRHGNEGPHAESSAEIP